MALEGTFDLGRCLMVHFGGSLSGSNSPQAMQRGLGLLLWKQGVENEFWKRNSWNTFYLFSFILPAIQQSLALCYCCCTTSTAINWVLSTINTLFKVDVKFLAFCINSLKKITVNFPLLPLIFVQLIFARWLTARVTHNRPSWQKQRCCWSSNKIWVCSFPDFCYGTPEAAVAPFRAGSSHSILIVSSGIQGTPATELSFPLQLLPGAASSSSERSVCT